MRVIAAEPLRDPIGYALAVGVTAASTLLSTIAVRHLAPPNLVMIYLLGVTYVASRASPRAAVLASFLSVAAFDYCFVPPGGTFAVQDVEYVITFGVMLAVSLLISTLTVRLREQSEARHQAALSAQFEKVRGDLLSSVSHDLRTPLASIEGAASGLLEQADLNPRARDLAQTVVEESERMARLIRNLLDMTRFEGGAIQLDLDWHSLEELVGSAIIRTERLFVNPVQANLPQDLPLMRVDGVLIEQALINLIENSARHGGREVRVQISAHQTARSVVLEIFDNGPGIPVERRGDLFEKFQRKGGNGFGLGLAICRAVATAHGGTIAVGDSGGHGAKFVLALPMTEESRV